MRKPTKKLIATAYHEAGHSVAWFLQGHKTKSLTIVPNDDYLGAQEHYLRSARNFRPDLDLSYRTMRRIDKRMICIWAGPLAEKRYRGRMNRIGAGKDFEHLADYALRVSGDEDSASEYVAEIQNRTEELLADPRNWSAVEALAAALLERGTLKGKEVSAIISGVLESAAVSRQQPTTGRLPDIINSIYGGDMGPNEPQTSTRHIEYVTDHDLRDAEELVGRTYENRDSDADAYENALKYRRNLARRMKTQYAREERERYGIDG